VRRLRRLVRRHAAAVALGLAALHAVLALATLQPAPHPGGDNAVYLALARGLLEGEGYRDFFDPAAPRHTQFPPGFPAIVAGALLLGAQPWVPLKGMVVAFSAAAVALTFLWLLRRRRPLAAVGVALLVAIGPGVLRLAHTELSDVPFWTFTMAALLAWERAPRRAAGRVAAGALAVAAAYLVRTAGVTLVAAAAISFALRRRWRHAVILAAGVVPPLAAWALWSRGGGGYADAFRHVNPYDPGAGTVGPRDLLLRLWENVGAYADRHLPMLLTGSESRLLLPLTVAVVVLAAYGWASRVRRPGVAEVFLPLYLAMLLVWPVAWAGTRFLLPVLPLLLAYAGEGLWRAARETRGRVPPAAAGAVAVALVALAALPALGRDVGAGAVCRADYRAGDRYACEHPARRDFYRIAEVAAEILPEGSVVINRKPSLFHAISGHPGRVQPYSRDPETFFRAAREAGARYVVVDQLDAISSHYLVPVLMRRPAAFCAVHALGPDRTALMGILPGAETAPDAGADPGAAAAEIGFTRCPADYVREGGAGE
jgi:hypothetical protein